jgi:hypothetical protein
MTPLSEHFPLISLLNRDPTDRSVDLDLLDRIVHEWLLHDFRNHGHADMPISWTGDGEHAKRRLLYRSALERLEARVAYTQSCDVHRAIGFAGSDFSDLAITFLLYLILSEWFA